MRPIDKGTDMEAAHTSRAAFYKRSLWTVTNPIWRMLSLKKRTSVRFFVIPLHLCDGIVLAQLANALSHGKADVKLIPVMPLATLKFLALFVDLKQAINGLRAVLLNVVSKAHFGHAKCALC